MNLSMPLLVRFFALLFLLIGASTGPTAGTDSNFSIKVVLGLDVSVSMEAHCEGLRDFAFTFLDVAAAFHKEKVDVSLLTFGENVGVLKAFDQTAKPSQYEERLKKVTCAGGGYTWMALGIQSSAELLNGTAADRKAIVIVSDGKSRYPGWAEKMARAVAAMGVRISTILLPTSDQEIVDHMKTLTSSNGLSIQADITRPEVAKNTSRAIFANLLANRPSKPPPTVSIPSPEKNKTAVITPAGSLATSTNASTVRPLVTANGETLTPSVSANIPTVGPVLPTAATTATTAKATTTAANLSPAVITETTVADVGSTAVAFNTLPSDSSAAGTPTGQVPFTHNSRESSVKPGSSTPPYGSTDAPSPATGVSEASSPSEESTPPRIQIATEMSTPGIVDEASSTPGMETSPSITEDVTSNNEGNSDTAVTWTPGGSTAMGSAQNSTDDDTKNSIFRQNYFYVIVAVAAGIAVVAVGGVFHASRKTSRRRRASVASTASVSEPLADEKGKQLADARRAVDPAHGRSKESKGAMPKAM